MKIGFFIVARLKSTRLKRKILLEINGKSVLDRVIERAKLVKGIDGVVLCTSSNKEDSELFDFALKHQIQYYHGSEDDVLKRMLDAAKYYGYSAICNITADNPLFSIYAFNLMIAQYKKNRFDYIYTKGIPIGLGGYLLDVNSLDVVNYIKNESNTEIWGPFINRSDFFKICMLNFNCNYDESIRLTLDYEEDYEILKTLFSHFQKNHSPSIFEVINVLKKNPLFLRINENRKQIMPSKLTLDKIANSFDRNKERALKYGKSIGKDFSSGLTVIKLNLNEN